MPSHREYRRPAHRQPGRPPHRGYRHPPHREPDRSTRRGADRPAEQAQPGLVIATRHYPADPAGRQGGDWHQAMPLPGRQVLLAIGDVVGHGPGAAGTMRYVRRAVLALAGAGFAPGRILARLNRLLLRVGDDYAMSTAIVATYRGDTRELCWARGGHLPPLLLRGGRSVPLPDPSGAIVGAFPDAGYAQATVRLERNDVVLLYTDGMVEEPGRSLDDGIHGLTRAALAALHTDDPPAAIVARTRPRSVVDDACLLAAMAIR
ncbi:MAG TPA: PP2C family protein-serine/threonine phosphatase [Pilimelia sp.]|nr:PP2C family protein-serine/threonine phosphatase [Pilimelia sp.]